MANTKFSQINSGTPVTYTPATDNPIGVRSGTTDCLFAGIAAGPGSSATNHLASFSGTDGLTLADSGILTSNVALLAAVQTFTAAQTFTNSLLKLLGSSTGATTFTSANAGATNYTMTVPAQTDTLVVQGATTPNPVVSSTLFKNPSNAVTAVSNAATCPVTTTLDTVTNSSAATLTITMTTASAVDGQIKWVRVIDASAASQTITWVNTENGEGTAPVATSGTVNSPKTAMFMFNAATTKWRCIIS
jgi:hypothetical protein